MTRLPSPDRRGWRLPPRRAAQGRAAANRGDGSGVGIDTALFVNAGIATSVDQPRFDVSPNLSIRAWVNFDVWPEDTQRSVIAHWRTVDLERSWLFGVNAASQLRVQVSEDGITQPTALGSSVAPPIVPGQWLGVGVDFYCNVADDRAADFFTSSDGVTWTQLGTRVLGAVPLTQIFNNTGVPVSVGGLGGGGQSFRGRVGWVQWGPVGGQPVGSPAFNTIPPGQKVFRDDQRNVWTVEAPAAIGQT